MSYQILNASEKFTKEQKAREIRAWDVEEAVNRFGPVVGDQLARDMKTGFAFWDSCSMIEQVPQVFYTENLRMAFTQWALQKIYTVQLVKDMKNND